jgi:tRNA A-37 threonylcarbamoyl transferase component Bud32
LEKSSGKTNLVSDLVRDLSDCHITASPLNPDFNLTDMLSEVNECRIVKQNRLREVFHLQTAHGVYYLKRSVLVRDKDRMRHFLLPRRKWAEWRNLHRLEQAGIPAASPVIRGQSKTGHPGSYFIMTRQVPGDHIPVDSPPDACNLGRYAAYLHRNGVYHADLNRKNFILNPEDNQYYLLDVQQVYFLPWTPRWLRIRNLGRLIFNLCCLDDPEPWAAELLAGYNPKLTEKVRDSEIIRAARRHQERRYRSRAKRCRKDSSEFKIIRTGGLRGNIRRGFSWGTRELQLAQEKGKFLKGSHVIAHEGVCLKLQRRAFFHRNRCLASWKMSRALEVRGIPVPRSLGYFVFKGKHFFLSELLNDSLHLNDHLSSISDRRVKYQELEKLALWLRKIHDVHVWQRDFKSNNVLCRGGQYYMIDLDGVRIRRLTDRERIVNLAQLNASLSNAVTIRDRLRFFDCYFANDRLSRQQRREIFRQIWDITRTKGTADYGLDLAAFNMCRYA